jgi:class 3 adenylate cyclase/YHS domain-containing protein
VAGPGESHTFLFADLAGYTALTEAMGDHEAADLAARFCAAVRDLLPPHAAQEVKALGDALMLRVPDAADAVRLGLRIVNDVGGRHFFPTVRVGMHTGEAVERDGDWFGATVNVAARVSGLAAGGEVLLTDATWRAAGGVGEVAFQARGRQQVKNVVEPLTLYAAATQGAHTEQGLPIDPVCRMAVDPRRATGTITYQATEFHFCSLACVAAFAAAPERYAAPAHT